MTERLCTLVLMNKDKSERLQVKHTGEGTEISCSLEKARQLRAEADRVIAAAELAPEKREERPERTARPETPKKENKENEGMKCHKCGKSLQEGTKNMVGMNSKASSGRDEFIRGQYGKYIEEALKPDGISFCIECVIDSIMRVRNETL